MGYTVTRSGTTLVTLHEGTDTTARLQAKEELGATLRNLALADDIVHWDVDDASVHEHPTAPFDPYTVAVTFDVTVTVDADDANGAKLRGSSAIEEALESAALESVSYTSEPIASAV